jgi:predicted DsbA family dithiol-disulfide isomerase
MIRRDVDEGKKGGVMLTPVFAVGLTEPGGQALKVRRVVVGSQPYAVFEDAIEAVLSTAGGDR